MDDLIYRRDVIEEIRRQRVDGKMYGTENTTLIDADNAEDGVMQVPAVDAVEVVRCEDCEKGEITIEPIGIYLRDFVRCKKRGIYMERTGFCNYGERKGGASNDVL